MEPLIATTDNLGLIVAACITGSCMVTVVVLQWVFSRKTNKRIDTVHEEVKTNHGQRNGARMEQISDDIAQIKRTMVTKTDLEEHTNHDLMVAADIRSEHIDSVKALRKENNDTREILLSALQLKRSEDGEQS